MHSHAIARASMRSHAFARIRTHSHAFARIRSRGVVWEATWGLGKARRQSRRLEARLHAARTRLVE